MIQNWHSGKADNWDCYSVQILYKNGSVVTFEFDELEEAKTFAENSSKIGCVDFCEVL